MKSKRTILEVEEEDLKSESEESMPNFGFDFQKNANVIKDSYSEDQMQQGKKNKFRSNNKNAGNKLGFVSEEEMDLNKAIESLDNSLFRPSINADTDN